MFKVAIMILGSIQLAACAQNTNVWIVMLNGQRRIQNRAKHLIYNFFVKIVNDFKPACFPVNVAKFLRTAFYKTPPVAASVLIWYAFSIRF